MEYFKTEKGCNQAWKMAGSAGSGAARKFFEAILRRKFVIISQEIFSAKTTLLNIIVQLIVLFLRKFPVQSM